RSRFAGVVDDPGYSGNTDYVHELGLEKQVEILGHLPHSKALEALKSADILILIGDTDPDSGSYIPGKLYEYMAIGHPILALSLSGESTQIIEKFNLGEVVDPSSLEQIKSAILKLYGQWSTGNRERDGNEEPQVRPSTLIYERKEQARMLAALMDELADDIRR
ncbi:MAG TPA: glycosyltransferase, partial [Bacilli bacterium]